MLKINTFIFVLSMFFPLSALADLTASVDNLQVPYGETLEFRLSYQGNDGNALQPDFSVLQKDFDIYSTSSSMNTQFINGNMSQTREWILRLLPKNEGVITIPEISAGKYSSRPLKIEVLSADKIVKKQNNTNTGNNIGGNNMAVFSADFNIENKNPYVEQGIAAVLKIHDNRNLQFNKEPYFENENDWVIKRIDNPRTTNKGGENITEIRYIIYPQKSGVLDLPRAVVEGYYVVRSASSRQSWGGSLMDFFDMGDMLGEQKPVLFKSKPQTINVRPVPSEFKGKPWIPAEILVAAAEWSDKNPKFKVGETVAREIIVTASGVDESQLPEIELANNKDWKQYPDKPQYASDIHEGKLISQEVVRVVYIPQKSGKLKLPEIRIPWFNVNTQKMETAVIDGEEVEVAPNEAYEAVAEANKDEIVPQIQEKQQPSNVTENNKQLINKEYSDKYFMIALILAAFLSGLAVSFLLFGKKKSHAKETTETEDFKNIKKALSENDYRTVRDNLVHWGQTVFQEEKINNLNDLAKLIDDNDFNRQCELLNAVLYADSNEIPDKKIIVDILKKTTKKKICKVEKPLPNLYK